MAMSKKTALRVLASEKIAAQYAQDFAAYFGDAISGPMVELPAGVFNDVMAAWESQDVTKALAAHIQNAIIAAERR